MKVWKCRTLAQRTELAEYFANLCKVWAHKVGLTHWDITVSLEFGTDVTQEHREQLDNKTGAVTVANPTYERASIYLCALDEDTHWTQREVEEFACHEVVHILLSPVTNSFGDNFLESRTIESTVTRTSRALMGWLDQSSIKARQPQVSA